MKVGFLSDIYAFLLRKNFINSNNAHRFYKSFAIYLLINIHY